MDDTDKQKLVVKLIVGGVVCVPVGGIFVFFGGVVGMIFGLLLMPAGLILVIVGLVTGWRSAFGDPRKRPIQEASGVYVIAKVVIDDQAQHVLEPSVYDPEELKFIVRIRLASGKQTEFETSIEVYDEIGEGMFGDIIHQGKWLSQFKFRPKPGGHQIGEDPFVAGKL